MRTDRQALDRALFTGAVTKPECDLVVVSFAAVPNPAECRVAFGWVLHDHACHAVQRAAEQLSWVDSPQDSVIACLFAIRRAEIHYASSLSIRSHHPHPFALLRGEVEPANCVETELLFAAARPVLTLVALSEAENHEALALARSALDWRWEPPDA